MQLERRFDWQDTSTIYLRADEQKDFEPAKGGMVSFTVQNTTGKFFKGRAYPTSCAQMVDTPSGFWKLERGEKFNNIIPCSEKGTKYLKGK